jgi:uncharacterized membrane protein YedE/YeeE
VTAVLAFAAGLLFALGLGLGGMTQPTRVLGFLDVFGKWDPTLAFVMAGAVGTYGLLRPWVMHRRRPVLGASFVVASRSDIDAPLIGGAVLFGMGWGLVGFCPGPALVALGAAVPEAALFAGAMMTGMLLYSWRRTRT